MSFAPTSHAIPVKSRIYDQKTYSGNLLIQLNGQEIAKVTLSGSNRWIDLPEFDQKIGDKITISGDFKPEKSWFKRSKKGSQEFDAIDIGQVIKHLSDTSLNMTERFNKFLQAKELFELKNQEALFDSKIDIEIGDKSTAAEIKEAEKTLGYALPKGFVQFLEGPGSVTLDDSNFAPANLINNALQQMEYMWGTPKAAFERMDVDTLEFYKSGVILYTESGDGYGGLLYKPNETSGKNGKSGYYYFHQDSIGDPEFIYANSDPDKAFINALCWIFRKTFFELYEVGGNTVILDSSSVDALPYLLEPQVYEDKFTFRIRVDESFF